MGGLEMRRAAYAVPGGGELTVERRHERDVVLSYQPDGIGSAGAAYLELLAGHGVAMTDDFIGAGLRELVIRAGHEPDRRAEVALSVGQHRYDLDDILARIRKRETRVQS